MIGNLLVEYGTIKTSVVFQEKDPRGIGETVVGVSYHGDVIFKDVVGYIVHHVFVDKQTIHDADFIVFHIVVKIGIGRKSLANLSGEQVEIFFGITTIHREMLPDLFHSFW